MGLHRCIEAECPCFGQATTRGCGCHQTDEQVLREQRDELLMALYQYRADLRYPPAPDSTERRHAMIDALIAKVGEAA